MPPQTSQSSTEVHRAAGAHRSRLWIDVLVLAISCAFFFFFGLSAIGLVGADEPRYAQIAREMLARHDWVTPVLYGKPWLEKPVLYYWQAMLSYRVFGVSDWAARLPAAIDATALVAAVYLFARRFLAGVALDAALIAASTAFVVGFGHAASTDMPLAASFGIGMLCWLACWLRRSLIPDSATSIIQNPNDRLLLLAFYMFLALGTLAKGPVAPFLAALVIVTFAAIRRDVRPITHTLWWPAILLYVAVALPWYVLVQMRTGNFFRVFILEHNLQRYGSTVYHHTQPFWYYLPITLAGLMPWTVLVVAAVGRAFTAVRRAHSPHPGSQAANAEVHFLDLPERPHPSLRSGWGTQLAVQTPLLPDLSLFMLLWALLPVVFFSFSGSKLPGYILPTLAPFAILVAMYIQQLRVKREAPHRVIVLLHALLAGATLTAALLAPYLILKLRPTREAITVAASGGTVLFMVTALAVYRAGMRALRLVTLLPVILSLAFLLRVAAPVIDQALTARPVARELARMAPANAAVVGLNMPRELEYGLGFYRQHPPLYWDKREAPAANFVLMARNADPSELTLQLGPNRCRRYLGSFPPQKLNFYWVTACDDAGTQGSSGAGPSASHN